jgi:hypothetical protein
MRINAASQSISALIANIGRQSGAAIAWRFESAGRAARRQPTDNVPASSTIVRRVQDIGPPNGVTSPHPRPVPNPPKLASEASVILAGRDIC